MTETGYRLILASGSPRRKEILESFDIPYEVMVSGCDEDTDETDPAAMAMLLSKRKAADVRQKAADRALVLAADTVVSLDQKILGKPSDEKDAEDMLKSLSGRAHEVYTGVAVILPDGEELSFSVCTKVYVRPLTEGQIREYIATGEPMDKAGAYGIQGRFGLYIEKIDGDYLNVVGLPISEVYHRCMEKGYDLRQ